MSGINNCDTPGCTADLEVVTPSGYVCRECADKHADDVLLADGSGAMGPGFHAIPVHIERDGKRVAAGALLPSGAVSVEWNRDVFLEGERTEQPIHSLYGHIDDAEQASGGTVVITDSEEPKFYCDDCEMELTALYDDREDLSTPIVCGHCGGNNTRLLKPMTDGGTPEQVGVEADADVRQENVASGVQPDDGGDE